jgi:hypothetical protein
LDVFTTKKGAIMPTTIPNWLKKLNEIKLQHDQSRIFLYQDKQERRDLAELLGLHKKDAAVIYAVTAGGSEQNNALKILLYRSIQQQKAIEDLVAIIKAIGSNEDVPVALAEKMHWTARVKLINVSEDIEGLEEILEGEHPKAVQKAATLRLAELNLPASVDGPEDNADDGKELKEPEGSGNGQDANTGEETKDGSDGQDSKNDNSGTDDVKDGPEGSGGQEDNSDDGKNTGDAEKLD